MADVLTRPELAAERALARLKRLKVTAAGGCPYCTHRLTNWGGCEKGRAFPRCLSTPGTQFEPDHEKLKGESHAQSE